MSSAAGTLTVLKAGPDWEVLSTNDMDEPLWATPAIDGSNLFIRAGNSLYCYRGSGAPPVSRSSPSPEGAVSAFARLAGAYRADARNAISIRLEDNMLLMQWGQNVMQLVPSGPLRFRTKQVNSIDVTVQESQEGGAPKALVLESFGQKMVFERQP